MLIFLYFSKHLNTTEKFQNENEVLCSFSDSVSSVYMCLFVANVSINYRIVNKAPVVQNPIPDQNLTERGASFVRDLNTSPSVFSDSDGNELTFQAISSA